MNDNPTSESPTENQRGLLARFLKDTEIDTRLLGMIGALALIWTGFHFYGVIFNNFGAFLTPRNLWNLSVQTSSIGIMATGMVLVIVTRNIDLSVGSMIGVIAMAMGLLQVEILPQFVGIGHWSIWIMAVVVGLIFGTLIGALHGWLIAYRGIPAFIVTLGGLMVWRGMAFFVCRWKDYIARRRCLCTAWWRALRCHWGNGELGCGCHSLPWSSLHNLRGA